MPKQKFAITRHSTSQSCVADGKPLPEIAHRLNEATGVIQQYWESPGPSRELLTSFLGSCRDGLSIGAKFVFDLGRNIHLGCNVTIGDNVTILDCGDVFIGDNVHIQSGVSIYNAGHDKDTEHKWRSYLKSTIWVGDNVTIGEGAVILPSTYIGSGSVIAPGAVVKGDVGPDSYVDGNASAAKLHKLLEAEPLSTLMQSVSGSSSLCPDIGLFRGHHNMAKIGLRYRHGPNIGGSQRGFTFINANVTLDDAEPITFGDHCLTGPGVKILTNLRKLACYREVVDTLKQVSCVGSIRETGEVRIGTNVFIAGRVIVTPGVTIGDNATLFASNSVIARDIPDNSVVICSPTNGARIYDSRDERGDVESRSI